MQRLKHDFGIGKELIQIYSHPYIYLNRSLIAEKGIEQLAVERAVVEELQKIPGIAALIATPGKTFETLPYINFKWSISSSLNSNALLRWLNP